MSGYWVLHVNPRKCALYQGPRINRIIREDMGFGHVPVSQMGVLGPEALHAMKDVSGEGKALSS